MKLLPSSHSANNRQTGAALITGLIFLVVLSMIGITAANMSTIEERMSGNMRDRSLAMQAAELALRDAERDIMGSVPGARSISGITGFVADCGESTADTADNGLCYNGSAGYATPVWTRAGYMMIGGPSVGYGDITGAQDIAGIVAPRYLIEGIRKTPPGGGQAFYYRITVRAQGVNENTVVWLQEVLSP
jgi:type IV pilus assembly protein PilX